MSQPKEDTVKAAAAPASTEPIAAAPEPVAAGGADAAPAPSEATPASEVDWSKKTVAAISAR